MFFYRKKPLILLCIVESVPITNNKVNNQLYFYCFNLNCMTKLGWSSITIISCWGNENNFVTTKQHQVLHYVIIKGYPQSKQIFSMIMIISFPLFFDSKVADSSSSKSQKNILVLKIDWRLFDWCENKFHFSFCFFKQDNTKQGFHTHSSRTVYSDRKINKNSWIFSNLNILLALCGPRDNMFINVSVKYMNSV